jgi:hypothetical protein
VERRFQAPTWLQAGVVFRGPERAFAMVDTHVACMSVACRAASMRTTAATPMRAAASVAMDGQYMTRLLKTKGLNTVDEE